MKFLNEVSVDARMVMTVTLNYFQVVIPVTSGDLERMLELESKTQRLVETQA